MNLCDTSWIDTLKDWWWLAALLIAFLVRLWRTAIKTNKRLEELDKVAKHDGSIKGLEDKVSNIEEITKGINQKLERHERDNRVINSSLLAILEAMDRGNCENIPSAKDKLQKHLIDER